MNTKLTSDDDGARRSSKRLLPLPGADRDAATAAFVSASTSGAEFPCPSLVALPRIDTDNAALESLDWDRPRITCDDLAVLQYTSGSMGFTQERSADPCEPDRQFLESMMRQFVTGRCPLGQE